MVIRLLCRGEAILIRLNGGRAAPAMMGGGDDRRLLNQEML